MASAPTLSRADVSTTSPKPPPITIRPIPRAETLALRHAVLWPSVPLSAQAQIYDVAEGTVHLGAFESTSSASNTEPVGVLTLVVAPYACPSSTPSPPTRPPFPSRQLQLRKFAVSPAQQGYGIGSAMLSAAVVHVRSTEPTLLHLDARREQVPFYAKRGFTVLDEEVFVKTGPGGLGPGVEYVRMGRRVESEVDSTA